MFELPTPKSKIGWVVAVFYTVLLFLLYYLFLFTPLLDYYTDLTYKIHYQPQGNLEVVIMAPKRLYDAEPPWLYISATNDNDEPIYNVNIYVDTKSEHAELLLLPSLYGNDIYNKELNFRVIEKHATVTGRTKIISQENLKMGSVILSFSEEQAISPNYPLKLLELHPVGNIPSFEKDPIEGIQRGFVEIILLPPWSNGFIFVLVLFSVYISERSTLKEIQIEIFSKSGAESLLSIGKHSLLIIIALFLFVILFLTAFPLIFILVIIICIIYFWKQLRKENGTNGSS